MRAKKSAGSWVDELPKSGQEGPKVQIPARCPKTGHVQTFLARLFNPNRVGSVGVFFLNGSREGETAFFNPNKVPRPA